MYSANFFRELTVTFFKDLTCALSVKNWRDAIQECRSLPRKRMINNFLLVVPQAAIFYLVLSPAVAMPFYNKMLFFPTKVLAMDFDSLGGVKKENVYFQSANKNKLHAWYFDVPDARGVTIISHGNAGNISYRVPLIQILIKQKLSVLAYDYEGYGNSEGDPSIDNICNDGVAAYDFLTKDRGIAPEKIIVYGESLGGGVSSYIAANRKVGAIIMQSTFSSLPHIARSKMLLMRMYPLFLFPKNKLDSAEIFGKDHAPLLIVHGKNDGIIPYEEAEVLHKRALQPKTLVGIERADHNDMYGEFEKDLEKAISGFVDSIFPAEKTVAS